MVKKKATRPYHHGDLRAALLRAAELALESTGSEDLSLRELSRELGVSNMAPRRHFANKQALLDALALEGFERLGAVLNRAIADREQNFDARIVKLARAHVRFATKHPALIRLMFSAKHRADAPGDLIAASHLALASGPATVADGQVSGAVVQGDPARLALVVFSAVEGLVALSTNGQFGGVSLDRLVEEIVAQIILGLRPRL
jgi:AcrR family transcriptional regulator